MSPQLSKLTRHLRAVRERQRWIVGREEAQLEGPAGAPPRAGLAGLPAGRSEQLGAWGAFGNWGSFLGQHDPGWVK